MLKPPADAIRRIASALIETPVGEAVHLSRLKDQSGVDVFEQRYLLQPALRLAADEAGAVFTSTRAFEFTRRA